MQHSCVPQAATTEFDDSETVTYDHFSYKVATEHNAKGNSRAKLLLRNTEALFKLKS